MGKRNNSGFPYYTIRELSSSSPTSPEEICLLLLIFVIYFPFQHSWKQQNEWNSIWLLPTPISAIHFPFSLNYYLWIIQTAPCSSRNNCNSIKPTIKYFSRDLEIFSKENQLVCSFVGHFLIHETFISSKIWTFKDK